MVRRMTMDDFTHYVLTAFPEAIIDEDARTGELIIHTNHKLVGDVKSDHKLDGEHVVRLDNEKPF